jgi:RNA polymerase sigma factor (TIGR02999 family)
MDHEREAGTSDLLRSWAGGDVVARDELMRRFYPELRRLAAVRLREMGDDLTFQPTDLAHEAYLRLVDQRSVQWMNRSHFFAIAARLIRQILLNHVRDRGRLKRGGHLQRVTIDVDQAVDGGSSVDFLVLDESLDLLAQIDSQAATVVELRYIMGLSVSEVAQVLRVSESTVARQWRSARLWLRARMRRPGGGERPERDLQGEERRELRERP